MNRMIGVLVSVLVLSSISFAQPELDDIKAKAEECTNAFFRGENEKFLDLTFPKLIDLFGGRTDMISFLEKTRNDMRSGGFEAISATFESPKEIVPIGTQLFAVVPYTWKMKVPGGTMTQRTFLFGISNRDNVKWTFVSVPDGDDALLNLLLPDVVGKITLPKKQPPVFARADN